MSEFKRFTKEERDSAAFGFDECNEALEAAYEEIDRLQWFAREVIKRFGTNGVLEWQGTSKYE